MHGGLELARPRRRKKRIWIAAAVLLVVGLVVSAPYGAALLPAGLSRCMGAVGNWVRPHYTEELAALQQQNARLHSRLALARKHKPKMKRCAACWAAHAQRGTGSRPG